MQDKTSIFGHAENRLRDLLIVFAPTVEGSSLYLLRAIDETVDSLQEIERFASAIIAEAHRFTVEIREAPVVAGHFLDPDDRAINRLEAGYGAIEERLPGMLLRKSAFVERLESDRSELLTIAFDRCIKTMATLVEAVKDLRAAVISRDLAAELAAPSESFESPSAPIDALHTKPT